MKAVVINKSGCSWDFKSIKAARQYLKKDVYYEVKIENGKKVAVFDERNTTGDNNGK